MFKVLSMVSFLLLISILGGCGNSKNESPVVFSPATEVEEMETPMTTELESEEVAPEIQKPVEVPITMETDTVDKPGPVSRFHRLPTSDTPAAATQPTPKPVSKVVKTIIEDSNSFTNADVGKEDNIPRVKESGWTERQKKEEEEAKQFAEEAAKQVAIDAEQAIKLDIARRLSDEEAEEIVSNTENDDTDATAPERDPEDTEAPPGI